jgi:cytochrome c oxidase cbb3-type subunit 2
MNSGPLLFLGLFVTMACSWLSFVLGPQLQIGDMRPTTNMMVGASGQIYPNPEPGAARQGAEIYRANGCVSCHTEQVRPPLDLSLDEHGRPRDLGADIYRGWGIRGSTGYDYLFEQPVLLGSQRVGPDLANAGRRMDAVAVLVRLYEPRALTPGSIMPPHPFLFDKHKIQGLRSADALQLPAPFAPLPGYEIVPRPEARALAAYVTSLHQDGYLFEAPPPPLPPGKTNAPAKVPTKSLSVNRLLKKEPSNFPFAAIRFGLGSATVPVAAVGVPPTAFRGDYFRPEAESGGRYARAPNTPAK